MRNCLKKRIPVLRLFPLVIFAMSVIFISCTGQKATGAKNQDPEPLPVSGSSAEEKVILSTEDGLPIFGTFVYPDDGERHPAVILCHQFRSDRSSYRDFQDLLADVGLCSLAIDFRGFGESTSDGLSYKKFGDEDYANMLKDIKAALVFLKSGTARDRVNGNKIGLAGASIGANLAIMAGSEIEGLSCIASLSPGRSWHGLEPIPYAPEVAIPVLIAYAKGDKQSAEVILDLTEAFAEGLPEVITLDGNKHGTNMLPGGFDSTLRDWLKEQLTK